MRRALPLVAVLLLAAGCGSTQGPTATPSQSRDGVRHDHESVTAPPKPHHKRLRAVRVTVLDGDTGTRVARAHVRIGHKAARTDRTGVARIVIHRGALPVTISRRGYATRTVRLWFKQKPQSTARIYQPRLQWPMYGADPGRTQAQGSIKLRPPFKTIWSRGLGSLIEFPAVVSDGRAYIGNYRGTIYGLAMRSGKVAWKYDPPGGKMASSPAVVGEQIVVHGMDGWVRVLDRSSGRLAWSRYVGSPIESSPVVRGGIDYFGAWNGRVYALDLRTKRFRWVRSFGAKITSSAALAGGRLYIGDYAGRIMSLSQRTGRVQWSRGVNGRVYGTPAVSGGRVFVPSSTGGSLTAFTTAGGYLWSRGTGAYVYSSPAVANGRVYVGSYNGLLYAFSARSGSTLWSVAAGGPVSGAVTLVGGVAYAGSTRGSIVGADARSGRVLLRFPHGEYVAVSGNGGTLLLHGYSRLYAVKPR
jgi:outer membrane protein assembly factor BamB